MPKNLKTITAAVAIFASFGVAGPASAAQDNKGSAVRCQAAQNGKHNGFECSAFVDDTAGTCPRGYELMSAPVFASDADANGNAWVCKTV